MVKKLGERVLPEILPILRAGLSDADADKRQGVCIGLNEIMKSTSRDHVIGYSDSLIPTVCKALSDTNGSVREAAAKTFDSLHSNVGTRVLEEILPDLLEKLVSYVARYYYVNDYNMAIYKSIKVVLHANPSCENSFNNSYRYCDKNTLYEYKCTQL